MPAPPSSSPVAGIGRALTRSAAVVVAAVLAVAGLVLMAGALLVGAATAAALYAWARLTGRAPSFAGLRWRRTVWTRTRPPGPGPAPGHGRGDVIDVEATEVHERIERRSD
jgi:hypothetical protein